MLDLDVAKLLIKVVSDPEAMRRQLAAFLNEAISEIEDLRRQNAMYVKYREAVEQRTRQGATQ